MIHNEAIRQIITEWNIYVWMKGKEEMDIHALRGRFWAGEEEVIGVVDRVVSERLRVVILVWGWSRD